MLQKVKSGYYKWLYGDAYGYTADHFYEVPVDEDETVEVFEPVPSHIEYDRDIQPRGRVTHTSPPEYSPDNRRSGGRIVKNMPKQLRKIREAQERVEHDD